MVCLKALPPVGWEAFFNLSFNLIQISINLKKMARPKYQTKEISIAAGGAANAQDFDIDLDAAYQHCTGVAVHEKLNGGISGYDIGISDDNATYHHLTDKRNWLAGDAVSPNEKYKLMYVPNQGQKVKVRVKPDAVTVSELKLQVVFRLENNEEADA